MPQAILCTDHTERRTLPLEVLRREDGGQRVFAASLSSETVVSQSFGRELLVHNLNAVDLRRAEDSLPLLLNHDPDRQIGVVEQVRLEQKRLVGRLKLSRNTLGREVLTDIRDGVLKHVSISYRIHKIEPGEDDITRVTRWELLEASIVAVPADITVGIGRSHTQTGGHLQMSDVETRHETPPEETCGTVKGERGRIAEILALARTHHMSADAEIAIRDGWSVTRFQNAVLATMEAQEPATPINNGVDIFGKRDAERLEDFSISKVVRAQLTGDWTECGFEREVSQELKRQVGSTPQGVFCPQNALAKRDVTKVGAPDLVGTDHMAGMFIENLAQRDSDYAAWRPVAVRPGR